MKIKALFVFIMLIPLIVGSVVYAGDRLPNRPGGDTTGESIVYEYKEGVVPEHLKVAPEASKTELVLNGLYWFPEKEGKFTKVKRGYWGTLTMATPGGWWVDVSVPLVTYLNGVGQYVKYVEFCGQSSNGAKTKPISWEINSMRKNEWDGPIAWPANNNLNCVGHTFTPKVIIEDLNIAVKVYYKNNTHDFSFYKAWAKVVP